MCPLVAFMSQLSVNLSYRDTVAIRKCGTMPYCFARGRVAAITRRAASKIVEVLALRFYRAVVHWLARAQFHESNPLEQWSARFTLPGLAQARPV